MFAQRLKKLTPYVPGEQPQDKNYIKLNTNEYPYSPCPGIKSFLKNYDIDALKLYPDPNSQKLREAIGKKFNLSKDYIFVGNGSDEILSFIFFAFFDSDKGILLFPEFTYSFYPVYCDFYQIKYNKIPLESNYNISFPPYIQKSSQSCGMIFPNPNAPTGIYQPLSEIKKLLLSFPNDKIVVIDEAYIDFGGETAISLMKEHPNLVVTQTFSKGYALAGLRLGYSVAHPELIQALFTVKDSFNSYPVDRIAQEIGILGLNEENYYQTQNQKVIDTRKYLILQLMKRDWLVLPSRSNFVFCSHPQMRGEEVYLKLKEKGILIRFFNKKGIDQFVRITIGTQEDIETLIQILDRI